MIDSFIHADGEINSLAPALWRDLIRQRGYQALIFDCDGTLVESSEIHFQSFQSAAKKQGFDLERSWYFEPTGLDRQTLFEAFAETRPTKFHIESATEQSILEFIANSKAVIPIQTVTDLVRDLSSHFPLAVATNAEREVATASLKATNLWDYFNHLVSISDGYKPKPSPDLFSAATKLLNVSANHILVFEDSPEGVKAALSAGLDVIQVASKEHLD